VRSQLINPSTSNVSHKSNNIPQSMQCNTGDMYSTQSRGFASALAGLAMGFGVGLGQLVAGLVGPEYGWRLPFVLVAVPALALVLLYALTTSEPQRGGQERAIIDFNTQARNKRRSASRASGDGEKRSTIIGTTAARPTDRQQSSTSGDWHAGGGGGGGVGEWGHFDETEQKRRQSIELTALGARDGDQNVDGVSHEVKEMTQSTSGAELFPSLSQSNTHISQLLGLVDETNTRNSRGAAHGSDSQERQQEGRAMGEIRGGSESTRLTNEQMHQRRGGDAGDGSESDSGSEVGVHAIATTGQDDYNIAVVAGQHEDGLVLLPEDFDNVDCFDVDNDDDVDCNGSINGSILYEERISWAKVKTLLSSPSVALIYAQGVPGSLPWGVMLAFFNDFLAQQKKVPVGGATGVLITFGLGGACGTYV
jgi:hypothetical protein